MRYAAYGSNLHPLRLSERVTSATLVTTSFLPGWSLRFHKRSKDESGKCNIVAGGAGIYLAIFDISAADKRILDSIEGVNAGYAAATLSVPGVGDCASYVAQASHIDDSLLPYDWYLQLVLLGARHHGFPQSYVDSFSARPTREDPDPDRRADRWRTVALLRSGS